MHPMPGTMWGHATQKTKWSGRPLGGSLPAEMCAHPRLLPASSWLLVRKDTDAREPHWTLRCLGSELRMAKLQDSMHLSDDTMALPCHPTLPTPWLVGWERETSFPLVRPRLQGACCHMLWSQIVTGLSLCHCRSLSIGLFLVCKTPGSSCWVPQLPLPIFPSIHSCSSWEHSHRPTQPFRLTTK